MVWNWNIKLIIKSECLESVMIWYLKVKHGSRATKDGGSKVHLEEESNRTPQKATQEEEPTELSNNFNHREASECHTSPHKSSHKGVT